MNRSQAFQILDLSEDSSNDVVKKKFRDLSKIHHPDKHKGDDSKFKEINSAYQRITAPSERETLEDQYGSNSSSFPGQSNPFMNFDFSGFGINNQNFRQTDHVQVNITLSFKESILGCQKEIKYHRDIKCNTCNGQGKFKLSTNCTKCGGKGQVIKQNGGMIMVQQCECSARISFKKCTACDEGALSSESTFSVNIPGGVKTDNAIRLSRAGNYAATVGNSDQYTDTFVSITVEHDPNLSLQDSHVIHNLSISLLEALKGCTKTVPTVLGDKEINIPSLSKNKDHITIPYVGINSQGDQTVILNVNYPINIEALINSME